MTRKLTSTLRKDLLDLIVESPHLPLVHQTSLEFDEEVAHAIEKSLDKYFVQRCWFVRRFLRYLFF